MLTATVRRVVLRSNQRALGSLVPTLTGRNGVAAEPTLFAQPFGRSRFNFMPRCAMVNAPILQRSFHSGLSLRSSGVDVMPTVVDDRKFPTERMRNVAIIAHVDHGKTTLVDCLLKQAGTSGTDGGERIMDSNALEKERGITILAKCTSVIWTHAADKQQYRINIVDTPGHADFGGEVERIMSMVDGVVLVVDASDGPMTQTKFVLRKALSYNLRPLVVINKVDRSTARPSEVENEIFDLFANLEATNEQMDYAVVYASARQGWATRSLDDPRTSMAPLFDAILEHVPQPSVETNGPFKMGVTMIEPNNYLGKLLLGRVKSGRVTTGATLQALDPTGARLEKIKVTKILARRGIEQVVVNEASAGDIVSLAGFNVATVNSTLCDETVTEPLSSTPIDPPTLSMVFAVNDSPLAGREGTIVTSTAIKARLYRECESNVSLKLQECSDKEKLEIQARGELQLGILLENMRREGFEVSVSPPKVVYRRKSDNSFYKHTDEGPLPRRVFEELLEPIEDVTIDVDPDHAGMIIEKLSQRKGELLSYTNGSDGRTRLAFLIPTRGLLGYRTEFQNDTKGSGVLNHSFHSFDEYKGHIEKTEKGAIVANALGDATTYALDPLQARGTLFINPGDKVYPGMVIGESSRDGDLDVNPTKAKELSNVRNTAKEDKARITPPRVMSLEEVIAYVRDDEVIEITPQSIRLRKRELDANRRRLISRRSK